MKNIMLALDEIIIRKGRTYASKHNLTLNSLVQRLLEKTADADSSDWLEECFATMDKIDLPVKIETGNREECYRAERLHRHKRSCASA